MLALNAIDLPSGDQAGSRSAAHPLAASATSRFASLPSGVIVQIASNQVTAMRLPSGDHAASRTPVVTAAERPGTQASEVPELCSGDECRAASKNDGRNER